MMAINAASNPQIKAVLDLRALLLVNGIRWIASAGYS